MSNSLSDYAQPLAWTIVVLSVCTAACIIVLSTLHRYQTTELEYVKRGYVKFTVRYPATFTDRTVWITPEKVEDLTAINEELTRTIQHNMRLVDALNNP